MVLQMYVDGIIRVLVMSGTLVPVRAGEDVFTRGGPLEGWPDR